MKKMGNWYFGDEEVGYLTGLKLKYKKFVPSNGDDHDHCNICGAKFSARGGDDQLEGYTDIYDKIWICDECFAEFQQRFQWEAMEEA